MKRNFHIFFALLALTGNIIYSDKQVLYSQDVINYEELEIGSISANVGADRSNDRGATALARMKTRQGARFSQTDFDADLKALSQEYDRIEPIFKVENGKLNISLQLHPKPIIQEIIWSGNAGITTDKLKKELSISPNELFDRAIFNKAFHKLKAYYVQRGYFGAELDYSVAPTADGNSVIITIEIKEGKPGFVKEIIFDGFTKKEEEEIQELIFTKEYSFFTSWLTNEGTLRQEVLRHDEMTILNFIQNEGYLDARLETKVDEVANADRVIIRFILNRGSQYTIGKVVLTGGESIIPMEKLVQIAACYPGEVYSPEKVRIATKALYDAFGAKGFIDTEVQPVPKRAGSHCYDITFRIKEEQRYRVGLVKVFGNHRTDTGVILHETLLIPGEYFNSNLLQKSEERLRNIGYFKNVNIYAAKSSTITGLDGKFRDIHVEVEEVPTTASFQTFVAYSTAESISGGVSLSESNFNIKGFGSIFRKGLRALRGGGEYLSMNATIGTKQLSYTLSWTKPYFMDTPWSVGVDLQKMRNSYQSDDYSIKSYSAILSGRYPLNAFMKFGTHYRIKHSFVNLKDIHHSRRNRELIRESRNGGLISAIGTELYYDSTNHPRSPTRGFRSVLSLEYAGVGGDHTFATLGYLNTFYWAPYRRGLFRFRANVQFIKTLGSTGPRDLPLDERLYAGGETSIRGYVFNRVGPKFHDKERTVRGGMSECLFSGEYKQYLFKRLDGFVFFDAGNAYWKEFYLGQLRYSAGYGIKIKMSEATPLTLGMGYPLNPSSKRDVKKFYLTFESSF